MADKGLKTGTIAPDFYLEANTGEFLSLSEFMNKPVILLFLRGTW